MKNCVYPNSVAEKSGLLPRIKKELRQNSCIYLMAIPVLLYYLIFHYGPMFGIIIAFKKYEIGRGIFASEWVGFKYFKEFFTGLYFKRTLRNTLLISIYDLLWGFPAPILFALLLNEIRNTYFKKTVQIITYLPHFISMVVFCGILMDFFSKNGVLTKLFMLFGGSNANYFGNPDYFRSIFVGSNIWQGIGWGSIIYLSALSGISQDQYEAATIDGAGRFRRVIHVTLPGLSSTIVIMLILRIGQLLSVGYEKIILLYNPGTYETADVISSYVYRMGLGSGQYSFSTAVGQFQSVINLILLILANSVSKKYSETVLF